MTRVEMVFRSALRAPPAAVWDWMTSVDGIVAELRPFFRMTTPPGVRSLTELVGSDAESHVPARGMGGRAGTSGGGLGDVAAAMASGTPIRWPSGKLLFRSRVYLFGLLPIDRSDLTLRELTPGEGFLEESPMLSMALWRHERRLTPDAGGVILSDRLTFEPRFAAPLVAWLIRKTFTHRHAVLRRTFGGGPVDDAAR